MHTVSRAKSNKAKAIKNLLLVLLGEGGHQQNGIEAGLRRGAAKGKVERREGVQERN